MISIIVPVLNEEEAIPGFINQLHEQDYQEFELIIADGGSRDRTVAVAGSRLSIERHPIDMTVIHAPKGRAWQMNVGAKEAHGEILLFLHADTYLPQGALRALEEAVQQDSRVTGGRFKVKLDNKGLAFRIVGSMINVRDRIFGGFTGDQAIFVRKDVFEEIGGFREIELCEDLDMAQALKKKGGVIRIPLCVTTAARRWEKSGIVRTILLMWIIRVLFYAGISPVRLAQIYADVR
ncbi:MAG TPA: TIGR04283 family arsenosugar biosynthesis glycosyltransferase [Candidatus Aquicultor sp.]|jgi:rSAM/selenodomain-associated transferase 2